MRYLLPNIPAGAIAKYAKPPFRADLVAVASSGALDIYATTSHLPRNARLSGEVEQTLMRIKRSRRATMAAPMSYPRLLNFHSQTQISIWHQPRYLRQTRHRLSSLLPPCQMVPIRSIHLVRHEIPAIAVEQSYTPQS